MSRGVCGETGLANSKDLYYILLKTYFIFVKGGSGGII
jgi:hypothetical protein